MKRKKIGELKSVYNLSRKHRKRRRKCNNHEKKVDESSDGALPETELLPISAFVNDKEKMVTEMFETIGSQKLMSMVPYALKIIPLEKLKNLCVQELKEMDEETIYNILYGNNSKNELTEEKKENTEKCAEPSCHESTNDGDMDNSVCTNVDANQSTEQMVEQVLSTEKEAEMEEKSLFSGTEKEEEEIENKIPDAPVYLNVEFPSDDAGKDSVEESLVISPEHVLQVLEIDEAKGKTLLEILELEMRARAIRALLQKNGDDDLVNNESVVIRFGIDNQDINNSGDLTADSKDNGENNILRYICGNSCASDQTLSVSSANLENVQHQLIAKCVDFERENHMLCNKLDGIVNHEFIKISDATSIINFDSPDSWVSQWLKSKEVQKVVSTSKICAKIRKRLRLKMSCKNPNAICDKIMENSKSEEIVTDCGNQSNHNGEIEGCKVLKVLK